MKGKNQSMFRKLWMMPALVAAVIGCHHAEVTCYSLSNPCEPDGIPFYLPKPLLIISKNFRNIEESGYGQLGAVPIPNTFDNQAQYADVKANISSSVAPATSSSKSDAGGGGGGGGKGQTGAMSTADSAASEAPGIVPPGTFKDGVTPDTFYTYHIVFVPDLTQKYAIKIRGGPGEVRAAMNIVNGWMFTGLGPFYLKDSSTAQNILATGGAITLGGRGVADVVNSIADLSKAGGVPHAGPFNSQLAGRINDIQLMMDRNGLRPEPLNLQSYAEIEVYEASLRDGQMVWQPLFDKKTFDRQILGVVTKTTPAVADGKARTDDGKAQDKGGTDKQDDKSKGRDKTKNPPDSIRRSGGGMEQSGYFNQPSSAEDIISSGVATRVANRFGGAVPGVAPVYGQPQVGIPGAVYGQPQAGVPGTAVPAAGPGNNVTVNVNPEQKGWFATHCWPFNKCCKPHPKHVQETVVGTEATALSFGSALGTGSPVVPGPTTPVESPGAVGVPAK
jgi:hypothetical protein